MIDYNAIAIALIGAIVSIVVARIQAGNKAEKTAKETTKNVINNGFGTEIRNKMAEMQGLIDSMAERLNTYTVVRLERDEFQYKIDRCPIVDCPLRKAKRHE